MEKQIIPPVGVDLLLKELTKNNFLRSTNRGNNELYCIQKETSPNLMREIGRLREITFRKAGGGTGESLDIDQYDDVFGQLIAWHPENKEIIGGYRFACMSDLMDDKKKINSPTGEIFQLSDKFIDEYLPYTIELGRSFVQPKYQPAQNPRSGLFSLDNLWDGLGTLIVDYPKIKHFFGKVTMYPSFNPQARNFILFFLRKYFPDPENLMHPIFPIPGLEDEINKLEKEIDLLSTFLGYGTYEEDFRNLMNAVAAAGGETIPPLVKQYMDLSSSMKSFKTSISPHFGDVEETGLLVTIAEIHARKKDRHVHTYKGKGNK
ncbi:MAG: GNAT family N-acetyltransferase [Candidatus Absconditabacterales bacterium]